MALFERANKCLYSYTICVVLVVIALAVNIEIEAYFVYSCLYLKKMLKLKNLIQTY